MLTQRNSNFPIQLSIYFFYAVSILTILYIYLIYSVRDLRLRLLELAVVWAIVFFLPPLFGFAVYFCFIHTTRHIRNIWMEIKTEMSLKALITQASILTIASWGMGITAFYIFDSGDLDTNIIRIIFIGLAALTVPHMILVDGFFRNK
jgi:Brp/Blh family beta-carotene 15,15'-monooxygenase